MSEVLLLVSADAAAEAERVERGRAPRRDYLELARLLGADILDFGTVRGQLPGSTLAQLMGRGLAQALWAQPRLGAYRAVFSDSEHYGLFVGIMLRRRKPRPRHVLLAHHLTPPKKRPFELLARPAIDELLVHAEPQRELAVKRLGFDAAKVRVVPYQVDPLFWQPAERPEDDPPLVSSAGLECRDYETLVAAAEDLPVKLAIGAASHWSSKPDLLRGRALPEQVTVGSFDYGQLRDLYSRSRLIAVPLFDVDFQAGITLILEAMAMAKAVVVTQTRGQTDVVLGPLWKGEDETWPASGPPLEVSNGIYVPPRDVRALRSAMRFLLEHPKAAAMLGRNGRRAVEEHYTVDQFARRLAAIIAPWRQS